MVMIRQGRRQGQKFSPRPQLKGVRGGNENFPGDKKFVDGGVIVVHRGPKGIICPGPPYFSERAWAARISDGGGGGHWCSLRESLQEKRTIKP